MTDARFGGYRTRLIRLLFFMKHRHAVSRLVVHVFRTMTLKYTLAYEENHTIYL